MSRRSPSSLHCVTLSDSFSSPPKGMVAKPSFDTGVPNVVCLDSDSESDGSFSLLHSTALPPFTTSGTRLDSKLDEAGKQIDSTLFKVFVPSASNAEVEAKPSTIVELTSLDFEASHYSSEKNENTLLDFEASNYASAKMEKTHLDFQVFNYDSVENEKPHVDFQASTSVAEDFKHGNIAEKWNSLERCSMKNDGERDSSYLSLDYEITGSFSLDSPGSGYRRAMLESNDSCHKTSGYAFLPKKDEVTNLNQNLSDDDPGFGSEMCETSEEVQIDIGKEVKPDYFAEDGSCFSSDERHEVLGGNSLSSELSAHISGCTKPKRGGKAPKRNGTGVGRLNSKRPDRGGMCVANEAEREKKLQERTRRKEEQMVRERQRLEERKIMEQKRAEEKKRLKEEEETRRKRQRLERAEEKKRLKEKKKKKTEEEKQQKENLRAEAAERKKLEREKERWEKGKLALKNITLLIDTVVVEEGLIGGQLLSRLAEKGFKYHIVSNKIKKSIIWQMKVPSKHAQTEFESLGSQDSQLSPENWDLPYILVVLEADQFSNLISEGSIDKHILNIQRLYPGFTICYIVNRLMSYLRKRNQKQYSNLEFGWTCPPVEQVLAQLVTHFNGVHSRLCLDEAEVADHVVGLTRSLAESPFRRKLTPLSLSANGDHVPKNDPNRDIIRKSLWLKALVAIPKVSGSCAVAIAKSYPTMQTLLNAYLDPLRSVIEKEMLLQDIVKEGFFGTDGGRRVGPACSRCIYRILTAKDGSLNTDDAEEGADLFED